MTGLRCVWWTTLTMVVAAAWVCGTPWWLAAPTLILDVGLAARAYADWHWETIR